MWSSEISSLSFRIVYTATGFCFCIITRCHIDADREFQRIVVYRNLYLLYFLSFASTYTATTYSAAVVVVVVGFRGAYLLPLMIFIAFTDESIISTILHHSE